MIGMHRYELFYKSQEQLAAQLPYLKEHGIQRVNLPNKAAEDDVIAASRLLRKEAPSMDVCAHFSCKYQRSKHPAAGRAPSASASSSSDMLSRLKDLEDALSLPSNAPSTNAGPSSILIISGGGKRAKSAVDTVALLQAYAAAAAHATTPSARHGDVNSGEVDNGRSAGTPETTDMPRRSTRQHAVPAPSTTMTSPPCAQRQQPLIAVAFNPYLPEPHHWDTEQGRLRQKLATGVVSRVFIQIGTDLSHLERGVTCLKQVSRELGISIAPARTHGSHAKPEAQAFGPTPSTAAHESQTCAAMAGAPGSSKVGPVQAAAAPALQLFGSVLLPSKKLLAQMRFRPWNGVFLSDKYLSGVDAAHSITEDVLRMYAKYGITPLIESAVTSLPELRYAHRLLDTYQAELNRLQAELTETHLP